MEHVSTLCAISTVGIAATGLALARLDHPAAFQNPAGSGDTTLSRITPFETVNPNTTRRRSALAAIPSKDRTGFQSTPTGSGQNLVLSQRRRERRRRQTVTAPLPPAVDETASQSRESTTNRPSSSWLRRISIISSTASSSIPSPTTTAPPLHGHSTQPRARRNSTAKVPNKLVKRSNSQQSIKHLGNRTKSTNLSSRRPATSHHWSGDSAHRSSPGREPDLSVPPTFSESMIASERYRLDSNTQRWRPFFSSASSRRRRDSTRNATIVTIKPNQPLHPLYHLIYPTLTLPSTLGQSSIDGNMAAQSSSTDPISFNDPFSPRNNESGSRPKNVDPSDQRRLVRSSSISDLNLNPGKPKDSPLKGDVRRTPTTAVRPHGKDRIVSNPLPRDSGKDGSPRLRRKRNFTESDTFNRPQTAPYTKQFSHKPANNRVPSPQHHYLASSAYPSRSTDASSSYGHGGLDHKSSPVGYPSYGISPPIVRYSRNKRLSGATADWASTVIGSDDTRVFTSADEDDQSDSVFDSFRTRISSQSHGGHRGPNIETIFRDTFSAIDDKHRGSVTVEGLGFENLRLSQFTPRSSVSDLESNTTPLASKNTDATPTPSARCALKNSPLKNPRILQTQDCNFDFDENGIINDDDDDDDYGDDYEIDFNKSFRENLKVLQRHSNIDGESPSLTRKSSAIGTKASVFDWSEQTWNERDPQASDVRPSTVHGKQGHNLRSTRRANRKAPSAMHLRSQSVPVSRDGPVPTDNRQPSAKFGTWGLGQKGVSEDWDGDFDFEDDDNEDENLELGGGISSSSGRLHTMNIPTSILERQASVHGQYGQVQELTHLVDELKRLRIQGNALQVINGPAHELWKEADGIVNLATFEDEEPNAKPPRSPSSCGSFDDFNESPSPPQKAWRTNDSDTKRPPLTLWSDMDRNSNSSYKEPSAKVPSVLESIYQQRGSSDAAPVNNANDTPQKLPFDTQSLKELVARAGIVTRALKDIIRRAEGVAPCEEATPMMDPPFSQIFTPRGMAL